MKAAAAKQVGVRELKAKLSEHLRAVKAGGEIVVTEHGRPVARLVPEPEAVEDRLRRAAAAGLISWTDKKWDPGQPLAKAKGGNVSDLVSEGRD